MRCFLGHLCGVITFAVLVAGGPSPPVVPQELEGTPVIVEFNEIKDGELINVKDEFVVLPPGDDELIIGIDSDETENNSTVVVKLEEEVESIEEQEETSSYTSIEEEPLDIDFDSVPVPEPIHDESDIYINKDNIVPILKTLALAYTRKESPSYKDILKAESLSGYKTAFKYLGKPSMGAILLKALRPYTNYLDDAEAEDEETEELSELTEKYLATHKFKVMFPESLILHEEDMLEFAMTREAEEVMTGLSATSEQDFTMLSPRADAVHTVLKRDDRQRFINNGPSVWLKPPPANFRSGQEEYHPHQAVDDVEYQRY